MSIKYVNPEVPFGFIIMENDNTFQEVSNLEKITQDRLFFVRFDTILQSLDCVNRNRRWYKGDAIYQSITTPEIMELLRHKKLQSEAGHPVDGSTARIATIDPKCTCNFITKMWRDGNLIRGSIETIDDAGGYGTKLTRSILQGMDPSYSYRGFAVMHEDKKKNIKFVFEPPRFITYDEVNLPSHKEAYAEPKKIKISKTFGGEETSFESMEFSPKRIHTDPLPDKSRAILPSDIREAILHDSDSAKAICESFDIDINSMATYGNHSFSIKSGSDTIVFQAEYDVARRYANIWGKF